MVGLDEDDAVGPGEGHDLGRSEDGRDERDAIRLVLDEDLQRPALVGRLGHARDDEDRVAPCACLLLEAGRHLGMDGIV